MGNELIVLTGATGNLGGRVAGTLLKQGKRVRAIIRCGSSSGRAAKLSRQGAEIIEADFGSISDITKACSGGTCVISAISGLRDAIIGAQTVLLEGAIRAGVPRFIPSDFSIDFTSLPGGTNRNLDLRREFQERLDKAPIAATSILNGMFTDLLTGPAPIILFKLKRVLFWEDADQLMDFTTIDNTARFTSDAVTDQSTPRYLRIGGDQISARGLAEVASEVTGMKFRLFRAGSLKRLEKMIRFMRAVYPQKGAIYPPWQGMQYLYNMFSGRAKLEPLDNDRYPGIKWTSVRDILTAYKSRVREKP